jgi:tetratricopeptide (TPR) repeat protein
LLGDGHVALAMGDLFYRWDVDAAYTHLQKGLSLSPGSASARQSFGLHLILIGEPERALEEMELAASLDPLSPLMAYSRAWALQEADRYTEVLEACDAILETHPMFRAAHEGRSLALIALGRLEEAAWELHRVVEMTGDEERWLGPRGYVAGRAGRTAEARRLLRSIDERSRRRPGTGDELERALIHLGLGEMDESLRAFDAAAHRRRAGALFSVNGVQWRELRADPRYWQIAERHGLAKLARSAAVARG